MNAENLSPTFTDPEVVECPFPTYRKLQDEAPIYVDPVTGHYVVTRYEDVRRILRDAQAFPSGGIFDQVREEIGGERARRIRNLYLKKGWVPGSALSQLDEPRHSAVRAIFDNAFRASRIREMDDCVRATAEKLVDAFIDRGECEVVKDFAVPMPLSIISQQMGADSRDMWRIKGWTDAFARRLGLMQTEEEEIACAEAEIEAQHYFKPLLDNLRAHPTGSLLSDIANARFKDGTQLSDNEIFAHLMADTFVGEARRRLTLCRRASCSCAATPLKPHCFTKTRNDI